MKRALVLLALSGCGAGYDFSGRYLGGVRVSGDCSDGSKYDKTIPSLEWVLSDTGEKVSIATGGTCGTLEATTKENIADVASKICPPTTTGTTTLSGGFTGGKLTLGGPNNEQLGVDVDQHIDLSGGASGNCDLTWIGTLVRQK